MVALIVTFTVKAGQEEKARELMRKMEEHTRREPGCRMYVGHQGTDNPLRFAFYEQYDDRAALDAHRAAPYFKEYVTNGLGPLMENVSRELFRPVEEAER
ncbi:MAG TPA: putative quinol monooxygenase [Terriglobales bacterium]|nr:putative quinol monooxygenase [Terriglobales bacterium]